MLRIFCPGMGIYGGNLDIETAKHHCEGITRGLVLWPWMSGQDSRLLTHKNSDADCVRSLGNLT